MTILLPPYYARYVPFVVWHYVFAVIVFILFFCILLGSENTFLSYKSVGAAIVIW